jgi:hypothetical protein
MGGRKLWHFIYGGGFAALLAVSVLAAAAKPGSVFRPLPPGELG